MKKGGIIANPNFYEREGGREHIVPMSELNKQQFERAVQIDICTRIINETLRLNDEALINKVGAMISDHRQMLRMKAYEAEKGGETR